MSFLVAGEIKPIRINTKKDISGFTGIALIAQRPDGSGFTASDPDIQLGSVDVVDDHGNTLFANQYVTYSTTATDFPVHGRYKLQLYVAGSDGFALSSVTKILHVDRRLPTPAP